MPPMTFLLHGNAYIDQDLYYCTGFLAEAATYISGDGGTLLVSGMEASRARDESAVDRVVSLDGLDYDEKVEEHGRTEAYAHCVSELLDELDVEALDAPIGLPAYLYRHLSRDRNLRLRRDILTDRRREKSRDEMEAIRRAVAAAESGILRVAEMLDRAQREGETLLIDGETLTSERLRAAIEHVLVDESCVADDLITASGPESYKPHYRGRGPVQPDAPLVLDVFPRRRAERYCGDVTRTPIVGENPEAEAMKEAVIDAVEAAEEAAEPGAPCSDVHRTAAETLDGHGYETEGDEGFVHGLGHGIGLDVHEEPRLSLSSDQELRIGDVFTIEPGLYYRDIGGVRIEDTVAMTENGPERLTTTPRNL